MKMQIVRFAALGLMVVAASTNVQAVLIGVSGPASSGAGSNGGTLAAIIAAPAAALDGMVSNNGQQGFNEAQNVTTLAAIATDSGVIAAGTRVNSHMIFLNSPGGGISHAGVEWTFDGAILGVMSDYQGNLEVASTGELGAAGTNYGPGAGSPPFDARGMEGADSYVISGNTLTVSMFVSQPGDWVRVVTAVPEPASLAIFGIGALGMVGFGRRRKKKQSA